MTKQISITTKPFREAHLDIFKVAESHKEECWRSAKEWATLGSILQAGSHMIDGRIIYVSGYVIRLPGVTEVFMHPSIYLPQYKLTVLRHIKWWLGHVAQESHARRLQTWGANTPESDRWLSYLGFKREGVLDSYQPDGSAVSIWGMTCKDWDRYLVRGSE